MNDRDSPRLHVRASRRDFLRQAGGLGTIALAHLLAADGLAGAPPAGRAAPNTPPVPAGLPHFAPRARRVIYLFMHGGPSHVDLFDPKPDLVKYAGQPLPESFGPVMTRRKVAQNPLLAPGPAVPAARASRAWRSATSCRTSPSAPTSCACSAAATATA